MCYGTKCRTVDPDIPIYCPDCLVDHFNELTEEDLLEMYIYFIDDKESDEEIKELFFGAFNALIILKRSGLVLE